MCKQTLTILGYRRPDILQKTCEALLLCRAIDKYNIELFIDKAPPLHKRITHPFFNNIDSDNIDCIKYARHLSSLHKNINTHIALFNHGITAMTDWCMQTAFSNGEFWTHFEEDVFPMEDALEFLLWGQEYLVRYSHILQIGAYGQGTYQSGYENLTLIYGGFCPWGFCIHRSHQNTMSKVLSNHSIVMPTWDCRIDDICKEENLCLLRPCISRVDKIGYDERSMHEWRHEPRDKSDLFEYKKQDSFIVADRSMDVIQKWDTMNKEEKNSWHWQKRKPMHDKLGDGLH